ncbi:MAG: nucleotidyltransferase family protein [Pseudomonadota bacterium]|nr:nucleotidyltransferase family protein [Pseudomonadota bacterium]
MHVDYAHVAIVLAAGGSRRLGQPKQLLRRDGETLVHRAARLAAQTQPIRLLIVVGAHEAEIREALHGIDAEILCNPDWRSGLAGSLGIAAQVLIGHDAATLVLGCDQPALEIEHLQQLLHGYATSDSGCAATLHDGQAGIPAVVSSALWLSASALSADRGLGAALRALPAESIALLDAPELCRDIDEPSDLESAIAAGLIDRP